MVLFYPGHYFNYCDDEELKCFLGNSRQDSRHVWANCTIFRSTINCQILNRFLLQIISMTKIFAYFHTDKFVTFCNSALLESCEKILDTFQSRCTRKKRKHSRRWPRFVQSDWKRGKNNLSIKNQRIRLEYCQWAGGLKTWLISLKMLGHKTYKPMLEICHKTTLKLAIKLIKKLPMLEICQKTTLKLGENQVDIHYLIFSPCVLSNTY